jgi:hypothetical protein
MRIHIRTLPVDGVPCPRGASGRAFNVRFAPDNERIGDVTESRVGPKAAVRRNAVIVPMSEEKLTSRAQRECVGLDPSRKWRVHRSSRDNGELDHQLAEAGAQAKLSKSNRQARRVKLRYLLRRTLFFGAPIK